MNLFSHHQLHPHHRYQLEVIGLFVATLALFILYWILVEQGGLTIYRAQWYFFWPWVIVYSLFLLRARGRIPAFERISPMQRPIIHWVVLSLLLLLFHMQPLDLEKIVTIDLMFLVFSLFCADAYWDFKNI